MEQNKQANLLFLLGHTIRFVGDHPYAAMGIFGAAIGSAVTYTVLTSDPARANGVFTPKVYKLDLPRKDVQRLLLDPMTELRWETPTMVVIVSMEQPEPLKQLPYIDVEPA